MAIEAARLFVSIGADMAGLTKGLQNSNNSLVNFGSSMMVSGAKMTAFLTAPAILAGASMLKVGFAAEQNQVAFETMLGSAEAAGTYLNQLRDFASKTPFQFPELVDASRRMLAFGFASKEVIPMLTTIGDAVAGLGLGSSGVGRVTLALGQMSAKGKVSAQEMMQLTETGIPAWKYLADAMGVSTAEVMKMTEKGLIPAGDAIDYLLKGMQNDFGGLMVKQADTAGGALSNLQDEVTGLATDMATLFLPTVKDIIVGLQDFVSAFSDLDPETQKTIINLGLMAAAAGPVMTGFGALITVGGGLISMFQGISAGLGAWNAGMSLSTSLGAAGLTPVALGLAAVAVAAAAVAAVWYTWNEQIAKTQETGMKNNLSAWAEGLNNVASKGGGARAVLDQYAAGVDTVNNVLEKTPWYQRMFIDQQGMIDNGLQETINVLGNVSGNYDEYIKSVTEAAKTAGYLVDAEGRLYTITTTQGVQVKNYANGVKILSGAQYENNLVVKAGVGWLAVTAQGYSDVSAAQAKVTKTSMESTDILSSLNGALSDAGYNSGESRLMTENLSIALGLTTQEQAALSSEVTLYSQAVSLGIISEQDYTNAMLAAKDGTLLMSEVERAALQDQINLASATRDAAAAANEQAAEMWGLAESFKGAKNAEIAKVLISDLNAAIREGSGDPKILGVAIADLGKQYGLMDDKSIALSATIPLLSDALKKHIIPADKAAAATAALSKDAEDGAVNWSKFLDAWKDPSVLDPMITQVDEAGKSIEGLGTTKIPATTSVITTQLPTWSSEFDKAVGKINDRASKVDLSNFNSAISAASSWVSELANNISSLPASLTISAKYTGGGPTPNPTVAPNPTPAAPPNPKRDVLPQGSELFPNIFDSKLTSISNAQVSQGREVQFNNYGALYIGQQDASIFGSNLLASLM